MSSDAQVASLRALAHPTRKQILALLTERTSMTATECAGILQLTPKTCSYHLQTLASSGMIEEISSPGRNRPWRLVSVPSSIQAMNPVPPPPPISPARSVRARREESLLDDAARGIGTAPPEWAEAVTVHMRVATMSGAELQAWCEDVERVTTRHVRRSGIPDDTVRSAVHLVFFGYPSDSLASDSLAANS